MEIKFGKLNIPGFIDETVDVSFEICNGEEEEAEASLEVKVMGYPDTQGKYVHDVVVWKYLLTF